MSRGVIINNEGALESVLNITTIRALDGDTAYIGEVWISNLSDDDIDAIKTAIEAYSPGGGGGEGYAEGVAAGKAAIATSQKLDIANYQVKLRNYDQDIADANINTNKGQLDVISESYQFIKTPTEISQIEANAANEARHLIAMDHQPIAEEYKSILSNVPEIQEQDPTDLIGQRNIFSLSADYLGGGATGTPFTIENVYSVVSLSGSNVWSDGDNIYYSGGSSSTQYVLNKETSTWSKKTWSGLTSFDGSNVWSDGENIYCSNSSNQYILDKETSTWSKKTWSGLTSFDGSNVWSDGENIYYSAGSTQRVLDKATSTWSSKSWSGLTSFYGGDVWTDGENIYYSRATTSHKLDKDTSTWTSKSLGTRYGSEVWTDGENIYYSNYNVNAWDNRIWSIEDEKFISKTWHIKTMYGHNVISLNPIKNCSMSCQCSTFGQDHDVNIDEMISLSGYKFYKDESGITDNITDSNDYYRYAPASLTTQNTLILLDTDKYRLSNVNMSFIPK